MGKRLIITENEKNQIMSMHGLIVEQNQPSEDVCVQDELQDLNDVLSGIVELDFEDLGGESSDEEILASVSDPKLKDVVKQILTNMSNMTLEELRDELKKIVSLRNIQEQQTPYMDRTTEIGGVQIPTVAVHGVLGLLAISILSKMIKVIGGMDSNTRNRRRKRYSRVASRATGCQGGAARARLQRMKRRRENWRSFLRKLGIR